MRLVSTCALVAALMLVGCSGSSGGRDAGEWADSAASDSGVADGATDSGTGWDASGVEDAGGDGAVDAEPQGPCLGTCDATTYNACTCGATDPCGWAGNGVCDDVCRQWLPQSHFDDLADCDGDQDSLYDSEELRLAQQFEPFLWLSASEEGYRAARLPHFAVEPQPGGGGGLSIFYAMSYFADYGDPDLGGLTSHLGDSEFVVVEISGGGPWYLDRVFLSAHYRSLSDSSAWVVAQQMQTVADATGTEHPVVYVSEWKHANYKDLQSCDNGAFFADHCEEFELVRLGIEPGRNVGNPGAPLVDEVLHLGNLEFYHSDVRFCGWQVASVDNADRGGCTGTDSTYSTFMGYWLADQI